MPLLDDGDGQLRSGIYIGTSVSRVVVTLSTIPRYDSEEVETVGEHAVVIGASVAGMVTARVLADAFERVTVIERDPLPDGPTPRRGVPQGHHVHLLLEAGRTTLADLFPNFGRELLGSGGVLVDASTDLIHYENGGTLAEGPERLPLYCASRPLFEGVVRSRLASVDGVSIRDECQFSDYRLDESRMAVNGLTVRAEGGAAELITAELVVDATGRTSNTPRWLDQRGFESPPVTEIDIDVTYSTVAIERPTDDLRTWLVAPSPTDPRGGAAVPIERDRWLVTLFGVHGERPPTDEAGFLAYADSLALPDLHRLLERRRWVSDGIAHHPFPSNRRHRYEALERVPPGLIVTGDAIASFNPIYGQGMSVAALEALQLHHTLARADGFALADPGGHSLPLEFYDRAGDVVDDVWDLTVGSDFAFPQTEGNNPRGTDLFNRYVSRLVRAAQTDGTLRNEYYRVVRLENPPTSLLRPSVVRRVLFACRSGRASRPN